MDPFGAVALGSAAGALFYVLNLLVGSKLHTNSEVNGLREDKRQLLAVNASMATAVKETNVLLQRLVARTENQQNQTGTEVARD